jgi:hypothetical protein
MKSGALIGLVTAGLLAACASQPPDGSTVQPSVTAPPTPIAPALTPVPSPTPAYPWTDESAIMQGLCFESVNDAAGTIFILRSPEELAALYDLADNSRLCRFPVERRSFDFSGGRILVGTWTRAEGCAARHEVVTVRRDDVARIFAVTLRLVVEGTCPYELVRPFWIGLSGLEGYDIRLLVSEG